MGASSPWPCTQRPGFSLRMGYLPWLQANLLKNQDFTMVTNVDTGSPKALSYLYSPVRVGN
jgi:hypothetical protein